MTNLLNTLGLAYKSKRILIGEDVANSLIKKKIVLIILASDASEKTKKRYLNKANFYQIPIKIVFLKEELGRALGKGLVSVVGIKDEALKNKFEKI